MFNCIIYIIAAALIGFGVYMLLLYSARVPTKKSEAVIEIVNSLDDCEHQTTINKLLGRVSKILLPLIELSDTTKYRTATALNYFHYNVTPEEHFCDALASGVMVGLLSLIFVYLSPVFAFVSVLLGFLVFKNEFNAPMKDLDKVREDIEYDAAILCKFIADALKENNRNVIDILTSCKESVSTSLKNELEHTITDLKTGNQEKALEDMSIRINTSTMTQIVVGLLGVIRGDNQTIYFEMLYEKFYRAELTMIRKKNSTKPGQISKLSMVLILAVVGMILVGMVLSLIEQLSNTGLF